MGTVASVTSLVPAAERYATSRRVRGCRAGLRDLRTRSSPPVQGRHQLVHVQVLAAATGGRARDGRDAARVVAERRSSRIAAGVAGEAVQALERGKPGARGPLWPGGAGWACRSRFAARTRLALRAGCAGRSCGAGGACSTHGPRRAGGTRLSLGVPGDRELVPAARGRGRDDADTAVILLHARVDDGVAGPPAARLRGQGDAGGQRQWHGDQQQASSGRRIMVSSRSGFAHGYRRAKARTRDARPSARSRHLPSRSARCASPLAITIRIAAASTSR